MELIYPNLSHSETFSTYYEEYLNDNLTHKQTYLDLYELGKTDYVAYLNKINNHRVGIDLPEDWAPSHSMFLIDDGIIEGVIRIRVNLSNEFMEKYIGHIGYDIRPSSRGNGYGNEILKLGLIKAREIGLKKVLLLCSVNNPASQRIIERNSGIYECDITTIDGEVLRRYWINLSD